MIVVKPTVMHFEFTHVESMRKAKLLLVNPTEVDAKWSIVHQPAKKAEEAALDTTRVVDSMHSRTQIPIRADKVTDDPSVFKFSVRKGTLSGPSMGFDTAALEPAVPRILTGSIPANIQVSFHPSRNTLYRSRFAFKVEEGIPFDVVISGHGSFEEFHR